MLRLGACSKLIFTAIILISHNHPAYAQQSAVRVIIKNAGAVAGGVIGGAGAVIVNETTAAEIKRRYPEAETQKVIVKEGTPQFKFVLNPTTGMFEFTLDDGK